jgi:hypothetical protein
MRITSVGRREKPPAVAVIAAVTGSIVVDFALICRMFENGSSSRTSQSGSCIGGDIP